MIVEVPIPQLIPGKTYFFFSHTYKRQPYNAKLLKAWESKVRLIDYELSLKTVPVWSPSADSQVS